MHRAKLLLSLSTNLSTAFSKASTSAYWYIKLYFDDESSFIGLSDKDRTINSVTYYGIVSSWGQLSYTANLADFNVTFGSMSIKIVNTPTAIENQRFSDFYSSREFTNRKWELYVADEAVTSHSDHQLLGTGIIGLNTEYTETEFNLTLNSILNKLNKTIPTTLLSGADVPDENVGKPVPFVYGDFDRNTSLPNSAFDRHTGGHAPMIISNKWDATNGMEAKADTSVVHTLRDKNMELYLSDVYASFDDNLVTINNSSEAKAFIVGNALEIGVFATGIPEVQNFSNSSSKAISTSNNTAEFSFGLPHFPKGVDRSSIKILMFYTSNFVAGAGTSDFFKFTDSSGNALHSDSIPSGTNATQAITLSSSTVGKELKLKMDSSDSGDSFTANIFTLLIVGDYEVDDTVVEKKTYRVQDDRERSEAKSTAGLQVNKLNIVYTLEHTIPKDVRMVYGSLKGRKYTSDLTSSRSNGYTTSDFIENPVYMIEDISRQFLGASIDTATFDEYGTKTTGKLKTIFNQSNASDVKLRFSQYALEDADQVLRRICRQSGLFYHFNESGAVRIFGRKRAGDYASSDVTQTIDFDDCSLDSISLTDARQVRNKITLNFNFDYGSEQNIDKTSSSTDSTSTGNTSSGYNITNELVMDAPYIADSTVADAYEDTLLDYYKDRKPVIKITTSKLQYVNIEIGDIVNLSNFPSNLKIFGSDLANTDYFMVTYVSKLPNITKLTITEVS